MPQVYARTDAPALEPVARAAPPQRRIPALDFTKGALVLIMVLYHWLNYFVSADGDFYKYLRFLTPSFIFISGFVIAQVYLAAPRLHDPKVPGRLLTRGLKLIALFIVLNAIRSFLIPDSRSGVVVAPWAPANLNMIFVTGNVGNSKATAFNILVPIGYLLILSSVLVVGRRSFRAMFDVTCAVCLLAVVILRLNGQTSGNLELIAIGLLGVVAGSVDPATFQRFVSHRILAVIAYATYLVVVTVWGMNYLLQILAVCVNLLVLYLLGESNGGRDAIGRHIILLGKYSLFGYIAQIAILQVLSRAMRHVPLGFVGVAVVAFVIAFAFTSLAVEIVDRARPRLPVADRFYKAVFA